MSFQELGLSEKVLKAVEASGYDTPTPIQAQAIPLALQGRDVLGIAQTGTGKTAAFTLPMLSMLEKGRARARMPRTLILEPTRELAAQVEESFVKYGVNHKLNVALLIGGVSFGDQEAKITRGADVLIATPGRLLDFAERGKLLLTGIEILVIDEADRMLDMGFIPDIERICKLVPFTRQTLFFSATMPPEITRLTEQFLHNPARVEVARAASTNINIEQWLVRSGGSPEEKREILRRLIKNSDGFKNALIFCNRKRDVQVVFRSLEKHGFSVGALHGDLDQRARMAALDAFRSGQVQLLVCSDVAARGLDIPDVSHVINYDAPHHEEDYVHRIGRTGRAGRSGVSFTIASQHDDKAVAAIERLIQRKVDWYEPTGAPDVARVDEVAVESGVRRSRRHAGPGRSEEAASGDRHGRHRTESPRGERSREPRRERPHAAPTDQRAPRAERPVSETRNAAPTRHERPRAAPSIAASPHRPVEREPVGAEAEGAFGGKDLVPSFLLRPTRPARPVEKSKEPKA